MSEQKLLKGGDLEYLIGDSGKYWGAAFRSTWSYKNTYFIIFCCTDDSKNPIIISIGHRISLDTAIDVVKSWIIGYRIPEPIRQADKRSRVWVHKAYDGYDQHHGKTKGVKKNSKKQDSSHEESKDS